MAACASLTRSHREQNGRKVVCGTQGGNLLIFTYGNFGDYGVSRAR
jgi:hypothetical protein